MAAYPFNSASEERGKTNTNPERTQIYGPVTSQSHPLSRSTGQSPLTTSQITCMRFRLAAELRLPNRDSGSNVFIFHHLVMHAPRGEHYKSHNVHGPAQQPRAGKQIRGILDLSWTCIWVHQQWMAQYDDATTTIIHRALRMSHYIVIWFVCSTL